MSRTSETNVIITVPNPKKVFNIDIQIETYKLALNRQSYISKELFDKDGSYLQCLKRNLRLSKI
jgi:hypothetical protein